jgi:hypothetical protein
MPDEATVESSPTPESSPESSPEDLFYNDGAEVAPPEEAQKSEGDAPESVPESEPGDVVDPTEAERLARSQHDRRRNSERFEKLLEERAEARAKAELLEKQLQEAREESANKKADQAKTKQSGDDLKIPELSTYESTEAWAADVIKLSRQTANSEAAQAAKAVIEKFQKSQEDKATEEASAESRKRWDTGFAEATKANAAFQDTYDTVITRLNKADAKAVGQAIWESDNWWKLVQELGDQPERMDAILQMSPMKAVMEIGKLDTKFGTSTKDDVSATGRKPPTKSSAQPANLSGGRVGSGKAKSAEDVLYG